MEDVLHITQALIGDYLTERQNDGLSPQTAANYRRKLQMLCDVLPEDKTIRPGTLLALAERLEAEGYSTQTVNVFLSAADGLLAWCGRYDLQAHARRETGSTIQPELTRAEYLRLLSAAKMLNKPKTYYLIKTFATLGVNTQEIHLVTVEAAQNGFFRCGEDMVRIPASFARELLRYAKGEGITSGSLFVTRSGSPLSRTGLNVIIASVQQDAQVAPEKCNPSCLRKLYQSTQAELRARLQLLLDQEYDRLLAQEDYLTGWDAAPERKAAYKRSAIAEAVRT